MNLPKRPLKLLPLPQPNNVHHLFKPESPIPTRPETHHHPTRLSLDHLILSKLGSSPSPTRFDQIHARLITAGLAGVPFTAGRLLKTSPDLRRSLLLFSQIRQPDVFCYNVLIKSLSIGPQPLRSFAIFSELLNQGLIPNEYTLCFLLDSCSHALALAEGRQLHAHLAKHGLHSATFAATSLLHFYSECGLLQHALHVFDEMPHRTPATWAAAINASVTNGDSAHGVKLFKSMCRQNVEPSNTALVSIFRGCAELGDTEIVGRVLHGYAIVKGLELDAILGTSLVNMYSKSGAIDVAVEVFDSIPEKGVESWNCMIHGLAVNGQGDRAVGLFETMRWEEVGLKPNGATFVGLLNACSHAGMVEDGIRYFWEMVGVYGVEPGLKHYGCMVDLYGRAGRVEEAMGVVKEMPMEPDAVIWGALLGACRVHGLSNLGELLAAKIIKVAPNDACGYSSLSR